MIQTDGYQGQQVWLKMVVPDTGELQEIYVNEK